LEEINGENKDTKKNGKNANKKNGGQLPKDRFVR
jgi:hypothetical protein